MITIDHPWQRMLLHAVCLCRRPRNSRFHLRGIARELPFKTNSEHGITRADAFLLVLSAAIAIATLSFAHQYTHPESHSPNSIRQVHKGSGPLPPETGPAVNELAKLEEQPHSFRKQ